MTTRQRFLAALILGVLLAAGGLSWFFMRGKGLVDETLSLQTSLLAGELKGRDRRLGVTRVTRNIDKMAREDLKTVRDTFAADWRRLRQRGIDEYFSAAESERESLLDRDIDRLVVAGDIVSAINPRASGLPVTTGKPKKAAKQPGGGTTVTLAAQSLAIYRTALLARAGKRGIAVPDWLLGMR